MKKGKPGENGWYACDGSRRFEEIAYPESSAGYPTISRSEKKKRISSAAVTGLSDP